MQRRKATLLGRAIAKNSIRDIRSKLQHPTVLVHAHDSSMVGVGALKYHDRVLPGTHDRVLVSKQCSLGWRRPRPSSAAASSASRCLEHHRLCSAMMRSAMLSCAILRHGRQHDALPCCAMLSAALPCPTLPPAPGPQEPPW